MTTMLTGIGYIKFTKWQSWFLLLNWKRRFYANGFSKAIKSVETTYVNIVVMHAAKNVSYVFFPFFFYHWNIYMYCFNRDELYHYWPIRENCMEGKWNIQMLICACHIGCAFLFIRNVDGILQNGKATAIDKCRLGHIVHICPRKQTPALIGKPTAGQTYIDPTTPANAILFSVASRKNHKQYITGFPSADTHPQWTQRTCTLQATAIWYILHRAVDVH